MHFIAKLRRRRSANWTQPNFAKRWTVNRANKMPERSWGRLSRKKLGAKNFYICSFFRRLRDVMANICRRKTLNRARALESTKGRLRCPKISWTLIHKLLKTGPEFLHTYFLFQSIAHAHPACGINVAPHSDSKWNGIELICSSDLKSKKMLSWKWYRVGRP